MSQDDLSKLNFLSASREGDRRGEFTDAVLDYSHEIREGPYECSWRFETGHEFSRINPYHEMIMDQNIMRVWFNNYMMTQVETRYAGKIAWRGYIVKMIMNYDGYLISADATQMANTVKCSYQYESTIAGTDPVQTETQTLWTPWYYNEYSLNNYGNWERAITYDGKLTDDLVQTDSDGFYRAAVDDSEDEIPLTEPENKASVTMERLSQPVLSVREGDKDANWMEFTAWGNMRLAEKVIIGDENFISSTTHLRTLLSTSDYYEVAWGESTIGDNARAYTVTDEILRLLDIFAFQSYTYGGDPVLWPLDVQWNDRPCVAGVTTQKSIMQRLSELAELRDLSGNYYTLTIRYDGGVIYKQIDTTPVYQLYPAPKGLVWAGTDTRPTWGAVPGMYKIMDMSMLHRVPDTWLGDPSIRYYPTVRMSMGAERADFGEADYTIERWYSAMAAEASEAERFDTE